MQQKLFEIGHKLSKKNTTHCLKQKFAQFGSVLLLQVLKYQITVGEVFNFTTWIVCIFFTGKTEKFKLK